MTKPSSANVLQSVERSRRYAAVSRAGVRAASIRASSSTYVTSTNGTPVSTPHCRPPCASS
eukprot:5289564-Heterocapsa_arctica.AAC.1